LANKGENLVTSFSYVHTMPLRVGSAVLVRQTA